ncbi:MAG: hypothetical protein LBI57_02615 [Helicobacteraceae bacterium]|jgi:hypothetical protein|nr:hypothetical protein [Helicobacteraceae bacterium]
MTEFAKRAHELFAAQRRAFNGLIVDLQNLTKRANPNATKQAQNANHGRGYDKICKLSNEAVKYP